MAKFIQRLKLLPGVIRDQSLYRPNNPQRARADAEYEARRPRALEAQQYRCAACGYSSKMFSECHHRDGDHANNADDNLVVVDTLCHAYQHLGQVGGSNGQYAADNLGGKNQRLTLLAAIPELPAEDTNLLQRAIGAAMRDEGEAEMAKRIAKRLAARSKPVQEAFGTFFPADFGAAMLSPQMDDASYDARGTVIGDLRLLFSQQVLLNEGGRFLQDFPSLPASTWNDVVKNA